MGVTYKLKQEVIDYILELKRNDPSLSCRKISDLSTDHFNKPISKSSVNGVLKTSSLSSPIGRRAKKEKKEEKFQIPKHRKEQIFGNVPSAFLKEKKPAPVISVPKVVPTSPVLVKPLVSPEPVPLAELLPPVKVMQPIENLGVLFLKVAEWQTKRQGVLRFLCEKFGPLPCDEKTLKLAEAFLFLPLCGEQQGIGFESFEKKDLWQVNDISFDPTTNQKKDCYDVLAGLESKRSEIAIEYAQMFSEASLFRFALQDGSGFCIDAQMNSCWPFDGANGDFSVCLDRGFASLSRHFISNISPIILRAATAQQTFPEHVLNMLYAFEDYPGKKITNIDVTTSKGENISSFDKIVAKKRRYILGLHAGQGFLSKGLADQKKEPKEVRVASTGEVYYCWEAETAFRLPDNHQISANVYFIGQDKGQPPQYALLTNIPKTQASVEEVAEQFILRWPSPLKGYEYFSERQKKRLNISRDIFVLPDDKFEPKESSELFVSNDFASRLSNTILLDLHDHLRRHFFHADLQNIEFAEAQKSFYGLSGEFLKEKDFLRAKFSIPAAYPYQKELVFLAERINEAGVFDPKGRRVFVEIAFLT